MKITHLSAYTVFDSRGMPTVEVDLELEGRARGRGLVPSGASTGQFEAHELRDGDPAHFRGRAVTRAVAHVNGELAKALVGRTVDQEQLDLWMVAQDGTPNKSRLGANALLGISLAYADARARALGLPLFASLGNGDTLPLPEVQIIGGGAHANWRTDIQDFLIIATGATSYEQVMEITFNVYHAAGDILKERGLYRGLADEGGYWPEIQGNEAALQLVVEAIQRAGYTPGHEVCLSLDIAASDLYDADTGRYQLRLDQRSLTSIEFVDQIVDWCERYPVISVEDPCADTDWSGWARFHASQGRHIQIIGDDLFTTNIARIKKGLQAGIANAVLIKLNQIGTVTETLAAIHLTQQAGWLPVISARSGETEDAFIAHLAVATNAGQLKVGSFARSERMAKWNEVTRIGHALGARARFPGAQIFEQIDIPPRRAE